MKYKDAMKLISKHSAVKENTGYAVSFERIEGNVLCSDHFPDLHAGEKPIIGLEEAWRHAKLFAAASDDSIVNVYVIIGSGQQRFSPVPGYAARMLKKYRR